MAGRIPQAFIQELLARTDIVQVIGERLQLRKAGKEYKALSPFTNEKTPSFTISPQKQFYHCFSSGKHGTAISFLMEYERLTFVEAVEDLARRAGLQVPREGGDAAPALVLDGPLDALAAAERFYKAELKRNPAAVDYLKKRGLTGETARRFGIGYAPDSWDALTKQFRDPAHALTAGLLIRKDGGDRCYDRFRNRIMFPIRDSRGRTIGFGGRTLGNDPAKYLNSPETPLFHKGRNLYGLYEARQASGNPPSVLVVEGYMDAVMLSQHGITNVVATLGTATTREHLNLLFRATGKVVFCFDGDRAGRAAGWRGLEQALPEVHEGRECQFMFLPEGHDPDTLVQEIGADEFRRRAEAAQPLSAFLIGELSRQVNLATPDGRAKLAALARPHVAKLREGPLRSSILDELTRMTRLTRADFEAAGARAAAGSTEAEAAGPIPLSQPVQRALQVLLERPELGARVDGVALLAQSDTPGVEILTEALDYFRDHPQAHAGQLLELWRDTDKGALLDRLAAAPMDLDEDAYENEFTEQIKKLEDRSQKHVLRERVHALLQHSQQRALTPDEQAEIEAIKRRLASRESV